MHLAFTAAAEGEESGSILLPALPDLIWGTVAFLIVLLFVVWKVLPNINKALDARAEAIEGGLKRAEEAQAQATAALEDYTAQLAEARAEAAKIRETARLDAGKISAEIREQAQADAARIVANAQTQIEAERAAALASLKQEVGTLALDLASGVVGASLSDDAKAAVVVDRFLAELGASK
ncbi:F0F1 ATP synthase subunit B [Protaetiibacter mangrovi]|uniref:ATP synthase subunit b n=1 Tax=Protaetiibacter mangrovi TaxID=2970926 RepID=A0ABT1ZJ06_9MICO|nr:F0F1 ATP synthase subunit B [Protaetiibacter mangrovi]MCS0500696.1 F0F1 ATP synthase subunit B [Protaetiibacter mangrovi]TPX05315.1 F0F1 ATP synthase subunit B [Schumannella luteola]